MLPPSSAFPTDGIAQICKPEAFAEAEGIDLSLPRACRAVRDLVDAVGKIRGVWESSFAWCRAGGGTLALQQRKE